MKKWFLIVLLFTLNKSFSQTLPDYESIKLKKDRDYKNAEPTATKAANYILSVPYDKKNEDRKKSVQFMVKWMSGTPDYSFELEGFAKKLMDDNSELLMLFMASMTKYATENKASAKDENALKLNSAKLLLAYCENPANKIKMTNLLKKLSEANKKGELEKEL